MNPAKLDANRRDSICISCHLEGDVSVERAGRSVLNYRPGDSIFDYLSYYVQAGAKLTARGVSEVEQLNGSTCKRMSGDRMSCTTCHDPHYTPDVEHRAAFFRGKCLTCHNEPEFASNHHPENQDCTSCHMRRTGAVNIPHVAWTDHRILKLPEEPANVQASGEGDKLVPLFATEPSERDLAMAHYQLLLEGDRSSRRPRGVNSIHSGRQLRTTKRLSMHWETSPRSEGITRSLNRFSEGFSNLILTTLRRFLISAYCWQSKESPKTRFRS